MSTTTALGFVKPGSQNEPADGFGAIGALADSVDVYATARVENLYAAWTSYTPTWSGGSPTIGNGTLTGKYWQVGKTVHYRIELTAGSTSTYGSGTWNFALPATPAATVVAESIIGNGVVFDSSAPARLGVFVRFAGTTVTLVRSDTGAAVSNSAPYAWATGDRVSIAGTYEAA